MNDEFLMQVDEEVPSDQRVAVNILETKVLSEEYREKLEMLLDKIEKISLASNIDILNEMKNILNDMLVSIISINKNYTFVSEMLLKINDMIDQNDSGEFSKAIENNYNSLSESISKLNEKITEISAGIDEKMSLSEFDDLKEKLEEMSIVNVAIDRKIDDKLSDIKTESRRLEEKMGEMSVRNAESMRGFDEKLYEINSSGKNMSEKIDEISSINAAMSDVINDINERIASRGTSDVEALREEMNEKTDRILSKVEKIEKYIDMFTLKVQYVRRGEKFKPRKARVKRARSPLRRRRRMQDEALDILIVNSLKNVSMNMRSLKTSTGVGEKRLKNRLDVLMTRGVVARERRGRSIFYVSRVDEATEMDN